MRSNTPVIDCHVHLSGLEAIDSLNVIRTHTGAERMCIVCEISREGANVNPAAFAAKHAYPDRFYVFGGLDHAVHLSRGTVSAPELSEQVERLLQIGVDGIKLLETKPDRRKLLDIPVDSDYYEGFFARAEEAGLPVTWHVADPPEFWDQALIPEWAKDQGWGYDETFVSCEQLYSEVENVLGRHPRLRGIFAHFFFLSSDLPRAASFFDRFEGVHLDLAPGIEMLYNLSRNPASRDFFCAYADRICFGTDIWGAMSAEQAALRAEMVRRWLESDDEFRVPAGADSLLGPPEDGTIKGLALPDHVLHSIYHSNFERLAGPLPRRLNPVLAAQECERLAREIGLLGGDSAEAEQAAHMLRS